MTAVTLLEESLPPYEHPVRRECPVVVRPGAFLAIVRDWTNIAPHPLLAELARVCVRCGRDLGDHGAEPPHTSTYGDTFECEGFESC